MQHTNPPVNKEQLSQLMDGEWLELNSSECVKGICSDPALRGKWARYHLIRDVMNREPVQADNALASRICAAIDNEPTYSNVAPISSESINAVASLAGNRAGSVADTSEPPVAQSWRSSWLGTGMTGFALAASVAAVTVVGMNIWQEQSPAQPVSLASHNTAAVDDGSNAFSRQVQGAPLPEVDLVANTGSFWMSPQSSQRVPDEERLNWFLSQHIENSPTADGLLPYSRLVAYEERGQER